MTKEKQQSESREVHHDENKEAPLEAYANEISEMSPPITSSTFNWLSLLQSKLEAIRSYQKYMHDAEEEQLPGCSEMLRRLYDDDLRHIEEIKAYLLQSLRYEVEGEDEDGKILERTVQVRDETGVVSEHGSRLH